MNRTILLLFLSSVVLASISAATLNVIDVYSKPVFNIGVLRNRKPVVVYFYNNRCKRQACEWVGPQLERITKKKSEQLYLAKVDTDKVPSLIDMHGLQTYPTVIVYKDGEIVDMVEGGKWGQIVNLVNRAAKM